MGLLDGLVVLVTGSTSGIGAAAAIQAAKEGARGVVVSGRREAKGREVVDVITALGGHAIFVQCDVRVEEQVRALVEATVAQYGRLDCAFNNAGVVPDRSADPWDADVFDQLMHTNTTSILMCMKYEQQQMSAQEPAGGSIVNCGSIAGLVTAVRFAGGYGASKAAISAITRSVAAAYISKGIRVNAVLPGATESEIWGPDGRTRMEGIGQRTPIGRHAEADEIAKPVVFLLSNYASYIVGQSIVVDGGLTIAYS